MDDHFIHLRVHSAYSLLEGAIPIKKLLGRCRTENMPAVAVTDTNNLFGAMEFATHAAENGIQPIMGLQLAVRAAFSPASLKQRQEADLVLIAQNQQGWLNLLKLASDCHLLRDDKDAPHLPLAHVLAHADGLICLTGGHDGLLEQAIQYNQADSLLDDLQAVFADRLYIELHRHPQPLRYEEQMLDLAYARNIPLVATNNCFFLDAKLHEAHDALLCIAEGRYVQETDRRRVTPHHHFKNAPTMRQLFADLPEACDNTLLIAQRCSFLLRPEKPMLPVFPVPTGETEVDTLYRLAREGLAQRLQASAYLAKTPEELAIYHERLEYELGVIVSMQFAGYFLIVSDFICWAKAQNIPVGPGRGSGAGSLVAYALLITDLDPLQFGLLFERFLNPERVSMPDFDIDFCQDRRDEVIDYVRRRYGQNQVAQIITFGKLQARAVLRDVGRVLQMPYGQVDRICKMVPNNPANPVTLQQAIDSEIGLREARQDPAVAKLMDIALHLEGLYRHASTHAAGVVIGAKPLNELIPLYKDPRSEGLVTQYNMGDCEKAGLVKFDFLGLKTLTVLQKAEGLVRSQWGMDVDITQLALADPASYELMSRGETMGVFQLESTGMRDVLRRMKPNRFEDIIALVSLYRPGPMDNIPQYIKVKNGEEAANYLHPMLQKVLEETFGIIVYQEQVMQIAQILAGYTLGGADLLRRAMGKKKKSEMDAQRAIFVAGAAEKAVEEAQSSQIFDLVEKFAGYGFNKSHAAAYALVAYQTAWLKANYPVAFMAASMSLDMGNTDKLVLFRQELQRMNIPLLPPDVNYSGVEFLVEKMADGVFAIRYALAAIKGVGEGAMQAMITARQQGGIFTSLQDFCQRLEAKAVNKRQLEALIAAGALDGLEKNRGLLFDNVELLLKTAQLAAADNQHQGLFAAADLQTEKLTLQPKQGWTPLELLRYEFSAIGFCLSAHPLDGFERVLQRLKVHTQAAMRLAMEQGATHTRFLLAGVLVSKQERKSAKGNRFAFIQLSDTSGVFEVMLFSELLALHRDHLETGKLLLIQADAQMQASGGQEQREGEAIRLTAVNIQLLESVAAEQNEGWRIYLRETGVDAPALKKLLEQGKNPHATPRQKKQKTQLCVPLADGVAVLTLKDCYPLTPEGKNQLLRQNYIEKVVEL
ncbi:MAG: DNA polymerase III subunit alpha [Alphaproteobacteria bacterium]